LFDDSKLLTRIWGKEAKPGSSSCAFLRNKISHELMYRALREVVGRETELSADIHLFIKTLIS